MRRGGSEYASAIEKRMDAVLGRFYDATYARFPGFATDDQLEAIGADRQLPRAPGEGPGLYAARLLQAWEIWKGDDTPVTGKGGGGGSPLGILLALKSAGIPTGPDGATIVTQGGAWAQLDVAGNLVKHRPTADGPTDGLMMCINRTNLLGAVQPRPGWTFDARDNFHTMFGIVFPLPWTVNIPALNAAVEKWRQARELFIGTWVINVGRTLGWPLGRTLATEYVLGGNVVTFYPGPSGEHTRIGYSP